MLEDVSTWQICALHLLYGPFEISIVPGHHAPEHQVQSCFWILCTISLTLMSWKAGRLQAPARCQRLNLVLQVHRRHLSRQGESAVTVRLYSTCKHAFCPYFGCTLISHGGLGIYMQPVLEDLRIELDVCNTCPNFDQV